MGWLKLQMQAGARKKAGAANSQGRRSARGLRKMRAEAIDHQTAARVKSRRSPMNEGEMHEKRVLLHCVGRDVLWWS